MSKEIEYEKDDVWRLGFHLMPQKGWLNDPNGLCWFQGYYHVYFQLTPDDPSGGLKHWGHYRSRDLIHWDYLGVALSPDKPYDKDGTYSGCAFVDEDDAETVHFFYTGNVKMVGDFDYIMAGRQSNTIYFNSKDGIQFSEKQCLLSHSDYPEHVTLHVRDPKVWAEDNGEKKYFMILGARNMHNEGEALIYTASDLLNWSFVGEVVSREALGYMWECPDVFEVNGLKTLCICPQGMEPSGFDYQNIYQSGYIIYEGDLFGEYQLRDFCEWDRGFDFYAPQTFRDSKGRRILIGWMGMPDTPQHENPTIPMSWQHALTIPREITAVNGRLRQNPLKEMEHLRCKKIVPYESGKTPLLSMYEAYIENKNNGDLNIIFADSFHVSYDKETGVFDIEFTGGADSCGRGRSSRSVRLENCRNLRMFVDSSAVEIFLNDGEEVFTTRFYPTNGKSNMMVLGDNYVMDIWELCEMKIVANKDVIL